MANNSGAIVESYNYDAYGNAHGFAPGNAATKLLFSGEYYDSTATQYYLRARWYSPANGRFNRIDPFTGNNRDPQSLHKYLYAHNNPVNNIDPSGRFFMPSSPYHGRRVEQEIFADFWVKQSFYHQIYTNRRINTILFPTVSFWGWDRPDLADKTTGEVWEIKSAGSYLMGVGQLGWYLYLLNTNDPASLVNGGTRVWKPGVSYQPPSQVPIDAASFAIVYPPVGGVIMYQVVDIRPVIAIVTAYAIAQLIADVKMVTLRMTLAPI